MHEVVHSINSSMEEMIINLYMQKAYDQVSWNFLDQVLKSFSFKDQWRAWVKLCISKTTFLVLVNGEVVGFFNSSSSLI